MKTKYYISVIIILAIIVTGFYYSASSREIKISQNKVLNFGAIISLSSYAAEDGEGVKNGLELAKKDLAKEGINVNIDYFDDATDPKQVVAGVQYMKSKNIDVVFGPLWSFLGDAALGSVNSTNITLLGPSMTSESVQTKSSHMIFGQIKNSLKLDPTIAWMKENNIKRPAILINKNTWGDTHAKIFAEATRVVGGNVVMNEGIGFGDEAKTLPALILKAKKDGADAILWSGSNDGEVIFVREMTKLGMKIPLFADEEIMTAVRKGLISADSVIPMYTWKKDVSQDFITKYKTIYQTEPNHYSDAAYDMLILATKSITKNGVTNNIKENMQALKYTGYTGLYQFDENGDRVGGKWEVIKITK